MKYAPLGTYLDSLNQDECELTLEGIGHIVGFSLPPSAEKKPFWTNNRKGKAQAGPGWLSAGWRVKCVHRDGERITRVTFRRSPESVPPLEMRIVNLTDEELTQLLRPSLESPQAFYYSAGDHMMNYYNEALRQGEVAGVNHRFDFVSEDGHIVGEMRLFKSVPERGIHSATFASISEAIFLLQHTRAKQRFIVFGGDERVPVAWLERHGGLATGVAFHFICEDGKRVLLKPDPLVSDSGGT